MLHLSHQIRFRLQTSLGLITLMGLALVASLSPKTVDAQSSGGGPITLRSDVQEANSITGVVTARGNVQINYPDREIQATSAQAQYYSKERRIVLSGDVYVLQEGNSLRAETITYLIDEGRFVALPETNQQVEAIYLVPEDEDELPTSEDSLDSDLDSSDSDLEG